MSRVVQDCACNYVLTKPCLLWRGELLPGSTTCWVLGVIGWCCSLMLHHTMLATQQQHQRHQLQLQLQRQLQRQSQRQLQLQLQRQYQLLLQLQRQITLQALMTPARLSTIIALQ